MGDNLDEVSAEIAPPQKRSLFKKPTWTKPKDAGGDSVEFFSRAKEVFPLQIAEDEHRRRKKLEKLDRKRSTESAEKNASRTPELKKRRISSQADEHTPERSPNQENHDNRTRRISTQSTPTSRRSASAKLQGSPASLSDRYKHDLSTKKQNSANPVPRSNGVISLMSDGEEESKDHDDLYTAPAAQNTAKKSLLVDDEDDDFFKNLMAIPSEEEDPPVPDEEFPELIARAREREKLKAEKSLSGGSASRALTDDIFQESEAMVVDPVVEILVTSEIEGTKPMMFKRKISQTLKQVREVWCDKQIHEHSKKAGVFLTWRGKKMFDSITCAILGLRAGIDGNVTSNNNALDDYGRIHLEAWTEDLYIASQRRLEQGHGEADAEAEIQETTHVEKINLSLQAKGLEPITLKVKSTTLIEKLIGVVRRQQDIPGDKDVQLFFDGDKLDPSARIEDTELGDMDTVEIHVR